MFASDAQAARCCRTFLSRFPRLADLWGPETTPSRDFAGFVKRDLGNASPSEQGAIGIALALWNGSGDVPLSRLMTLDNGNLRLVGALLVAVAEGPASVDHWLMLHEPAHLWGAGRLPVDGDAEVMALLWSLRDLGDALHTSAAAVPALQDFQHRSALKLCDQIIPAAHRMLDALDELHDASADAALRERLARLIAQASASGLGPPARKVPREYDPLTGEKRRP